MGFLLLPRIGEFTVFGESLQNYQKLNDSKQKKSKDSNTRIFLTASRPQKCY